MKPRNDLVKLVEEFRNKFLKMTDNKIEEADWIIEDALIEWLSKEDRKEEAI